MPALKENTLHTYSDIKALPEGTRAELTDGEIYYLSSPSTMHQRIAREMTIAITVPLR